MAVLGLLTIVLGILLLLNPLAGAVILPRVYVFSLVVGEIAALIGGLRMRSENLPQMQDKGPEQDERHFRPGIPVISPRYFKVSSYL
ncbi:MAG: hypothetical protein NHB15_18285 [Methanosarcina barkeri]|nr:hypothetical protein [Methanosarcina sp. ERenArc_MAG2]